MGIEAPVSYSHSRLGVQARQSGASSRDRRCARLDGPLLLGVARENGQTHIPNASLMLARPRPLSQAANGLGLVTANLWTWPRPSVEPRPLRIRQLEACELDGGPR